MTFVTQFASPLPPVIFPVFPCVPVSGVGQGASGAERGAVQGGGDAGGGEVRQSREQEALPSEHAILLIHVCMYVLMFHFFDIS